MKNNARYLLALLFSLVLSILLLTSCSRGREPLAEGPPLEETVFEALAQASKEATDAYYAEYKLFSGYGYFFNETSSMTVLDGEMTRRKNGALCYTTTVKSKSSWKYVDVTELQKVNFLWNPETRQWELTDYKILDLDAKWHIDGKYWVEYIGTIAIETGNHVGGGGETNYRNTFDFLCESYKEGVFTLETVEGEVYVDNMVRLFPPCSKGVRRGAGSFNAAGGSIALYVYVGPDEIYCVDYMSPTYRKIVLS